MMALAYFLTDASLFVAQKGNAAYETGRTVGTVVAVLIGIFILLKVIRR